MKFLLLVFLGGGMGSTVRFLLSKSLSNYSLWFPYGTLACNVISSILLGYLLGKSLDQQLSEDMRLLWAVGFCGGFSTFSTFSAEIFKLIQDQKIQVALIYIAVSVVLGVLSIFLGLKFKSVI